MCRTEELRQEIVSTLGASIADFEKFGNEELDGDFITLDYVTAKRLYNYLTEPATWIYYTNDEGKPRWRCSSCGFVKRRNPHEKKYCAGCSKPMKMEA